MGIWVAGLEVGRHAITIKRATRYLGAELDSKLYLGLDAYSGSDEGIGAFNVKYGWSVQMKSL